MKYFIKTSVFILIWLLAFELSAQTVYPGYLYTYDAAGNRIKKEYNAAIEFRKGSEEETTNKLLDCTVKVLPNPTKGWLEVTLTDLPKDSRTSISVCNLEGKTIFSQVGIGEFIRIDLGSSPNGVYIMRIAINDKSLDYKIIKQE